MRFGFIPIPGSNPGASATDLGFRPQSAIHEGAEGGSVIDPQIVDLLMVARGAANRSRLDALTPREQLVLGCLAQGMSNASIAAHLQASPRSVENHVSSIFAKLDLADEPTVHRRVKATLLFLTESSH